jgi:CRISPR/Cas system-associated endonuclease Cas3-HD
MLVPHILFHDLGKVCEETSVLFENYAYEAGKGSFFEELTAANLPTYFEQYE